MKKYRILLCLALLLIGMLWLCAATYVRERQVILMISPGISSADRTRLRNKVDIWYGGSLAELKYSLMLWTDASVTNNVTWFWEHQLNKSGVITQAKINNFLGTLDNPNDVKIYLKRQPKRFLRKWGWHPVGE